MFTSTFSLAEFSFPTGLNSSDAEKLIDTFGVGFVGKWPASFFYEKYQTQVGVSWNYIDTEEVSKLGAGADEEPVEYQEFHFSQELPYQVDIGVHTSLLGLDNSMNTYGGFVRWGFYPFSFGRLAFTAHATSANYRSLIAMNLYGTVLEADFYFKNLVLTAGAGRLRTTVSFHESVFGINSGGSGGPKIRAAKIYSHQFLRASYRAGNWNLGVQSDYIKESRTGLILGYLF